MEFKQEIKDLQKRIDKYIEGMLIPESPNKIIYESMKYSLAAGGKRIRPILCLKTYEMLGGESQEIMELAMAIECIHTYSLIHDDLPAMDNDDYRRGLLTNHKVYGEDIAILAGDGLLNLAFEKMIGWAMDYENPSNGLKAIYKLAKAAGIEGMIGGQVVDVKTNGCAVDMETINYVQLNKTSALIEASILVAALAKGVRDEQLNNLEIYARNIGISFQIKDDILDVTSSLEELGKNIGSDMQNDKSTFLSFHSIEESEEIIAEMKLKALDAIEQFENNQFFIDLADYLVSRTK